MIHHIVERSVELSNGDRYEEVSEDFMSVPEKILQKLVGDGKASIERGKSIARGLPYGVARISASCSIRLTCDQSKKGVLQTAKEISGLLDEILVEDIDEVDEFIRGAEHEASQRKV